MAARDTSSPPGGCPGTAFHPEFPGGRSPGKIRIDAEALRFEAAAQTLELRLDGLELRLGGASDRLVFFTHPSLPEVSVTTSEHAILDHPRLAGRPEIARQIASIRGKKLRGRLLTAAVLLAIPALVGVLILLKDPLVGFVAHRIPPALEVELGELIFAQVEATSDVVEDRELQRMLDELVAPLAGAISDDAVYPYAFHLVEDPTLNAFAIPGGHVVLHTGLVLRAEVPEEVLGVLAHEIAHVTRRHSLRQVLSNAGVFVLVQALVGDASGVIAVVADGGVHLLSLEFSRDFEREADDVGWQYLLAAGIDPRGMITLFEKLQAEREAQLGGGAALDQALTFLSTHPSSPERIARLTAKWHALGIFAPPPASEFEFRAFQDRIRHYLKRRPQCR